LAPLCRIKREKIMRTIPGVFIIESLAPDDEKHRRFEGAFLSHILNQTGAKVRYDYVRTSREFQDALVRFKESKFRYLHISCHSNKKAIDFTKGEMALSKLACLLAPYLEKRRIFFSACLLVTPDFAKALLTGTGCYSVIGPSNKIGFDESAIFWASLYHVMLRDEASSMQFRELRKQVAIFAELYRTKIRYYRSSKSVGFKRVTLPIPSIFA
jgi:hypothetical protein